MLIIAALLAVADPSAASASTPAYRDPFASIVDEGGPSTGFEANPLKRYAVDDMNLQGVVVGTASPRAMVRLPDGSVHSVRVGDGIGPALGRVKSIRRGVVVVEESWLDFVGVHKRKVTLEMPTTF